MKYDGYDRKRYSQKPLVQCPRCGRKVSSQGAGIVHHNRSDGGKCRVVHKTAPKRTGEGLENWIFINALRDVLGLDPIA